MPQNGNTMDKIIVSSEKVSSELAIFLFREDDNFIAYSLALDLSGYGKTPKISVLVRQNDELSNILDKKDFKKYHEPIKVPALA